MFIDMTGPTVETGLIKILVGRDILSHFLNPTAYQPRILGPCRFCSMPVKTAVEQFQNHRTHDFKTTPILKPEKWATIPAKSLS
jgi:hypothetical protein